MVTRLLAAVLLVCCAQAHAGYALVTPPAGVSGTTVGGSGSSLLSYARTASNNPWVNGSAAAQVTKTVGGRLVTMPVSMRLAANAGTFLAAAMRLNPAAYAITGAALWLGPIFWDAASSSWKKSGDGYCLSNDSYTCAGGALAGTVSDYSALWAIFLAYQQDGVTPPSGCGFSWSTAGSNATVAKVRRTVTGSCGYEGSYVDYFIGIKTTTGSPTTPTTADWDTIGDKPPCYGDTPDGDCMPDSIPNAWPGTVDPLGVPLPIEAPKIFPDASPWPQSMPYPVGDPVPVPGTSPQQYEQPYVGIKPSPTPSAPWRVDETPGVWTGEDPAGLSDPDPEAAPGSGSTPEEQQTLCDKDPEASACKHLDTPTGDALPVGTVSATLAADSGWGASDGACPSMVHTTLVGNVDVFGLFCTYLSGVRFLVIGFGGVMAVLIFLGRLD